VGDAVLWTFAAPPWRSALLAGLAVETSKDLFAGGSVFAAVIADMALDGSDEFIFVFGGDLCVAALAGHGDRHCGSSFGGRRHSVRTASSW
jgi:hypothetical protein